jgi:hypothetical protein
MYGDGTCYCCHRSDRNLTVDHCHETGRIRGMLCHPCNLLLGVASDCPDLLGKAIVYLSIYKHGQVSQRDAERLEAYKHREEKAKALRQRQNKRKKEPPSRSDLLHAIAAVRERFEKEKMRHKAVQLKLIA